jgi:hypothetical protein
MFDEGCLTFFIVKMKVDEQEAWMFLAFNVGFCKIDIVLGDDLNGHMFLPNEFSLFIIWNFDRRFLQNGCNSLSSSLGILMCWSVSMMTN